MTISITFTKTFPKKTDTLIAFTNEAKDLPEIIHDIDIDLNGFISEALDAQTNFCGKHKKTLLLTLPKNSRCKRVLLIGLKDEPDALDLETVGGIITKNLSTEKIENATCITKCPEQAASIAHGAELKSYKFNKYKPEQKKPFKATLAFLLDDATAAKKAYTHLNAMTEGVFLARDLVNEAPNALYPESYAQLIKKELSPLGVKVEILDEKKLEKLGMGAVLAVGMGSARPPRVVVMKWNGSGNKKSKPIGFVGKGVTFDTGGISLKPGAGMDEMKMDMGGSAAVVGAMKTIALQKSDKDVIGIVGLAENMPSDRAYRPGDIVKSYKGKHIEVLNTDAEGRLVLVDCLTYMQEKFDPELIVDLATLTGAMMVALAHEYTGVFVNDDDLWDELDQAGKDTGEKAWRMPLDEAYRKDVESDIGDVRNLAKNGRWGGACTAAAFLEHFIDEDRKWAHMDIAGTAFIKGEHALGPKGATGVGVRLLNTFVQNK